MATGKKVYYAITRGINVTDREGRGMRFIREAPEIAARLKTHPQVRDVSIVAFPDRRAGTGLYAFVEGSANERELGRFSRPHGARTPASGRSPAAQCAGRGPQRNP